MKTFNSKIFNGLIGVVFVFAVFFTLDSCGTKEGVCTACCGPGGADQYYCGDGWTEEECKEWNDLEVNGLPWFWHEGQTCESRGTPARL